MSVMLATLFIDPLPMSDLAQRLTFLPLCLLVAVGYRAAKVPTLAQLPRSALFYFLGMLICMPLIGFALWGLLYLAAG